MVTGTDKSLANNYFKNTHKGALLNNIGHIYRSFKIVIYFMMTILNSNN